MTPFTLCFRPEFSMDRHALTSILGEHGIDPGRIRVTNAAGEEIPQSGEETWGLEVIRVTITDADELVDLIEAINVIPDSHRMLQTLDTEAHYTGDFIDNEVPRAARIFAILDQAPEPDRAKMLYRQVLTSDLDLEGLLDGLDNDDPDPANP